MIVGVRGLDRAPAPADNHAEFALVIDALAERRGHDDIVAGTGQRAGCLAESDRCVRHRLLFTPGGGIEPAAGKLLGMFPIVLADANHILARPLDRLQQAYVGERNFPPTECGRPAGVDVFDNGDHRIVRRPTLCKWRDHAAVGIDKAKVDCVCVLKPCDFHTCSCCEPDPDRAGQWPPRERAGSPGR